MASAGYCVFGVIVPVLKVGSIIGRKGEHIKKMCEETRACIRVLDAPVGITDRILGSRALSLLGATNHGVFNLGRRSSFSKSSIQKWVRNYSARSGLDPADVPRLAEIARISLSPAEVEEFAPKIQQVVDWFGQLQDVDLQSIEPAIRADTEDNNLRGDLPETFENREAMIAAVPSYEEPYIKVPKVLNKE